MANNIAYEKITNQIVEALEDGLIPWEKPWNTEADAPRSVHGKKWYNLFQKFLRQMAQEVISGNYYKVMN